MNDLIINKLHLGKVNVINDLITINQIIMTKSKGMPNAPSKNTGMKSGGGRSNNPPKTSTPKTGGKK